MLPAHGASSWLRSGVIGARERDPEGPGQQEPQQGRSGSWTVPAWAGVRPPSRPRRRSPLPHSRTGTGANTGTSATASTGPERLRSAPQGPHKADADRNGEQAHPPGEWRSGVRHVPGPGGLRWDAPGGSGGSGGTAGRGHPPGGRPCGPRRGRNGRRRAGRGGDRRWTGRGTAGPRSGRRGRGDAEARCRRMVTGARHQQDDTEDQEHGDDRRNRKDGLGRGPAPSCHARLVSVVWSVGV
jgi:translation initiation factor IF-2